jgi:hypothetical protein
LSSLIRRTLHGRRFADYAVARYTLTVVGPAVTGRAGGGEGESAVNGLGAVREEGRIIERNGRFHGPPISTMGSTSYAPEIEPSFMSQYVTLLARLDPFGSAPF